MKTVVIGAGQAAIAFAAKLRELDPAAEITLVGDEPSLPYQRPPLSKKYMTGEMEAERLLLRPAGWYSEHNVKCMTGRRAVAIDNPENTVVLEDGERLRFDKLLIATGARPRSLPEAVGGTLQGVHTLRTLADADRIGAALGGGRQVLVVGGGYIGLEAAAVFAQRGMKVRVIEMADRILQRVAAAETADFVRAEHERHGVVISEKTGLDRLEGKDGKVARALLTDGTGMDVDMVIAGIGVLPNSEIARDAGIACSNGIETDRLTITSHPDVHAAGDVASFEFRGSRIRLESVQNAIDQAEHAARVIAGSSDPYVPLPWFWSDQYDMKLQIAGLNMGYDQTVTRPGSREGGQSVWYFAAGSFIAVDAINDSKAYMFGKKILELGRAITPGQAADPGFDLKALIKP